VARIGECHAASHDHLLPRDHAAAVVHDETDGYRDIGAVEESNVLRLPVFADRERLAGEIRNRVRTPVEDVDMHDDQVRMHAEHLVGLGRRLRRGGGE
jgi:hypothetical protein